jgi:hypothetical protein
MLESVPVTELGVATGAGLLKSVGDRAQRFTAEPESRSVWWVSTLATECRHGPNIATNPHLYSAGGFPVDLERLRSAPVQRGTHFGLSSRRVPSFARELSRVRRLISLPATSTTTLPRSRRLFCRRIGIRGSSCPIPFSIWKRLIGPNSRFTRETLVVEEFNASQLMRKIDRHRDLRGDRDFQERCVDRSDFILRVLGRPAMQPVNSTPP